MSVKTLEELELESIGVVLTAEELDIDPNFFKTSKRISKWAAKTNNHKFKVGDVYIVSDSTKDITSFRNYIRSEFKLGVNVRIKDEKAYCQIRDLSKKSKKKRAPRKPKQKKSAGTEFGEGKVQL